MEFPQTDVQNLAVRIEKLEAANRRWKSASAYESVSQLRLENGKRVWHEEACQLISRILPIKPNCCLRM